MLIFYILAAAAFISVLVLAVSYICFRRVFYSRSRRVLGEDEYEMPPGEIYVPYHEVMKAWIKDIRTRPHEDIIITSHDGLKLHGRYYEYKAGAPLELLFHGYQGNADRDLSGGVERCFALGRSALLIDHRASGPSDGKVITFGIEERKDALLWIDYAIKRFGSEVKIILTGVSMGAATVMMVAGEEKLPGNVVCVLADCGYSSAKEIIKKVIGDMHLPPDVFYPFVKLGAKIFGRFDLEETTPMEAVQKSKIPIIFIHGDNDAFVPYEMSARLYEAAKCPKKLVPIPGAGHGLAYPAGKELYIDSLRDFERECGFLN